MATFLTLTRWIWLALLVPSAELASAQELALTDLVPQLLALDQRDAEGRWLVADARVDEIEARLTAALRVPQPFEVALVRSGARIAQGHAIQNGQCKAELVHVGTGLELLSVTIAVDGEHVLVGTLPFADPEGASSAAKHSLANGFPLSAVPRLLQGISAILPAFPAGVELVHIEPERRLEASDYASLRCAVRVGEVEAYVQLALSVPSNPFHSGVTMRPVGDVLATLVALTGRLDFDFPHSSRLSGLSHGSDDYLLQMSVRGEAQRVAAIQAALMRTRADGEETASRWVAMEESLRLPEMAVDLAAFIGLTNQAVAIARRSEELLGAFGVAYDEGRQECLALAVTVPTQSLWDAQSGHVHVLRAAPDGGARAGDSESLRNVAVVRRIEFSATTESGESFRFRREAVSCTGEAAYDRDLLMQYRGLAAPNMVLVK